jgi:uncharacterized membrane protein YgdD (TMEM256/DUF423 family)
LTALGAIGAHAIIHQTDAMKETWKVRSHSTCPRLNRVTFQHRLKKNQVGSNYHLLHAIALAVIAVAPITVKKRNVIGTLFTAGIICFSGSCYTVVLMDQKKPYNIPAPFGGMSFIFGWLALAFL